MIRFEDWPTRLEAALREACRRKFHYGEWDCCLAAADLVLAMTGTDIAERWRGQYRSRKGALAIARELTGMRSIRAFLVEALDYLPSVPVACAQRGDLILLQRPNDYSLGVLALNSRNILIAGKTGFLPAPLSLGIRAWRI
jgi:hypothetical protein